MLDEERIHELIDDEIGEIECPEQYKRIVSMIDWVYNQGREEGIADYLEMKNPADEVQWKRTR